MDEKQFQIQRQKDLLTLCISVQKIIARREPSIAYICRAKIKEYQKELKNL